MSDKQVHVEQQTEYIHFADKLLTPDGVRDGARIEIGFDPAYQKLTFHRLVVYRDGKAIDRLPTQEIKVLQREENLDENLYDGTLSAVLILPDIRVGDVVEYAYTRAGWNPIFKGRFSAQESTQWGAPIRRFYMRLLCPQNRQFQFRGRCGEVIPKPETLNGFNAYTWEKTDVPALISDDDIPSWYDPYPGFSVSEYPSWAAVAEWAAQLFALPKATPETVQNAAREIRNLETPEARIMAALRYVQDNIRYLGLESGVNSHEPYPIDIVMERRFGDCKDKARLLCALLTNLGFDAAPALVNTTVRQKLDEALPSAMAFNHAVVRLRYQGRDYWLDPTRQHQGGTLSTVYFPPLGKALVADPSTTALSDIVPSGQNECRTSLTQTFSIKDYSGKCHLHVAAKFSGHDADVVRAILNSDSIADISKRNLNFYAEDYPSITETHPPMFHDDLVKNEIDKQEDYELSELWHTDDDKPSKLRADFYQRSVRNRLEKPNTRVRSMPFAIASPEHFDQTIRIELPEPIKTSHERMEVNDPSFHFSYRESSADRGVQVIRCSYDALGEWVEASKTPTYLANIEKASNQLGYFIRVNKPSATPAQTGAPPMPVSASTPASESSQLAGVLGALFVASNVFWIILLLVAFLWGIRWKKEATNRPPPLPRGPDLYRCSVCGRTNLTHPHLAFSMNRIGSNYCMEHLTATPAQRST